MSLSGSQINLKVQMTNKSQISNLKKESAHFYDALIFRLPYLALVPRPARDFENRLYPCRGGEFMLSGAEVRTARADSPWS